MTDWMTVFRREEVILQLETMEAKVSSAETQALHELQDLVNEWAMIINAKLLSCET